MITSHYFNNCHLKKVSWLLSEMLMTAPSLVCYCLDSSFHLNDSGKGIMGIFNRKVCTESTISAIHLELLHQPWGYCWIQVAYWFSKFLYLFTTSLPTVWLLAGVAAILHCVVEQPLRLMFFKESVTNSCSHKYLMDFMVWPYK